MRIVRSTLHAEAADALRERIFNGELLPGQWVDELALADQMGISRTPLREALKVLTAEGLVVSRPRKGSYVAQVTEADLDDIFPVLALLEGQAAGLAASRASAKDLGSLTELHDRLQRQAAAGRINDYYQTNTRIHEALIALAGNRWLAQSIADLRKVLKLSRQQQLRLPGRMADSCAEHMAVFAALKAHDAAGAEAAMRTHLLRQRLALKAYMAAEAQAAAVGHPLRAVEGRVA